jgi:hypothetical protein
MRRQEGDSSSTRSGDTRPDGVEALDSSDQPDTSVHGAVMDHLTRETGQDRTPYQPPYQKPTLERLGTLRELTGSGGEFNPGDGAQPYHRYGPIG